MGLCRGGVSLQLLPSSFGWLVLSWALCFVACLLAYLVFFEPGATMVGPGIFVGGLATCGWLFTNYRTRIAQIEKNSFDLILTYTKDKFYVDHRACVLKTFAPYARIDTDRAKELVAKYYAQESYKDPDTNASFSLVQIINFYEYLAIGIKSGILSEEICKIHFKTTLAKFHEIKSGRFVEAIIERDNVGRSDSSKSSTFSNYLWLVERWRNKLRLQEKFQV